MVDVSSWKKSVKRSVDRCRDAVLSESRERVIANHFILVRFPTIQRFQLFQTIQIEQRETRFGDRAKIASAAFHGENAHRLPCERIRKLNF